MAINRQFTLFPLRSLAYAKLRTLLINSIKTNGVIPNDLFTISANATEIQQATASDIYQNVLLDVLLHAVVDDDRKTVQTILNAYPELLLINPPTQLVIESKLTWQKFYGEEALKMAVKRKQIKMIELLLPYYDKLKQTEDVIKAKREALSAWKPYEIQKNTAGEDEISIPKEYSDYAQSLIDVFKDEAFPNGAPGKYGTSLNVVLSDKIELALSSLLNILAPKTAVMLDKHIDVELLLLAIYKAYLDNFQSFLYNWLKMNVLCIRVMGLTQSALIPETVEIFCEGLEQVVAAINNMGKEKEISPAASSHKLKGDEYFYRRSRDFRVGSGFDFLCEGTQGARAWQLWAVRPSFTYQCFIDLQTYIKHKQQNFWKCYENNYCTSKIITQK